MIYDLHNPLDRERLKKRIGRLMDGESAIVELTEKKPQRSRAQNSYLHLLLGELALQTGNTIEWVKVEYYKKECNRDLFVTRRADKMLGTAEVLRSSADLTTDEMTLSIERLKKWASEGGIDLPDAEDRAWLDYIEKEITNNRMWL